MKAMQSSAWGRILFLSLLFWSFPLTGRSQAVQPSAHHLMRITQGLKSPIRLAIHGGSVYVVDSFLNRILRFSLNGQLLDSLTIPEKPLALTVDVGGLVYLSARLDGRLRSLNFSRRVAKPLAGSAVRFELPTSAAFDDEQRLYVIDSRQARIVKLDATGQQLDVFGEGVLTFPTGIAFDAKNQRLLVAEHGGLSSEGGEDYMIYAFSKDGTLLKKLVKQGASTGRLTRAQGLAVDRFGRIYVADPFQGRVNVFSEKGEFLAQIGTFGRQPGQLRLPMDVAIDANNRVWVASMNNGSLEVFDMGDLPTAVEDVIATSVPEDFALLPNFPNPFNQGTYLPFYLARSGDVTLRIYNEVGTLVRSYSLGRHAAGLYAGPGRAVFWDGLDAQGKAVASGIYFYELQFENRRMRRKMLMLR